MKQTTYIQIALIGIIVVFLLFLNIAMIELHKELEDQKAEPCKDVELIAIKDLPKVNIDWTPVFEEPKPLPKLNIDWSAIPRAYQK